MTPLRQRMLEDMQVRNLSPNTQHAYIDNVARFARHVGRSPAPRRPDCLDAGGLSSRNPDITWKLSGHTAANVLCSLSVERLGAGNTHRPEGRAAHRSGGLGRCWPGQNAIAAHTARPSSLKTAARFRRSCGGRPMRTRLSRSAATAGTPASPAERRVRTGAPPDGLSPSALDLTSSSDWP
jgi:hypothetical protein